MNEKMKNRGYFNSLERNIILEMKSHYKERLEGLVGFGSNFNLTNLRENYGRDYDLLIVVSSQTDDAEKELHSLVNSFLLKFGIRIDPHLYDLKDFSRALREPDLIFISMAKKHRILFGTERFNTIYQLFDTINERHDYTVVV